MAAEEGILRRVPLDRWLSLLKIGYSEGVRMLSRRCCWRLNRIEDSMCSSRLLAALEACAA
jgi:hypothetical protein